MAGKLPGVEIARRRRFYGSGGCSDSPSSGYGYGYGSTRRSSFAFYNTSNHESHLSSTSSLQRRMTNQVFHDENLGGAAREAKERLDERLRAQWKSETKRTNNQEKLTRNVEERSMVLGDFHTEVFGHKYMSGSKRFSWGKLGWKASDQDECAVCLDRFRTGETLVNLPCAHRFHSSCLVPWLESNPHCPCCRMGILN